MKPDKTRLVWDKAAKGDGPSLNSVLLAGPDLLTPLADVLIRFREFAIAVSADIAEVFHQVLIRPADQDAQRFLWRPVGASRAIEFKMMRMAFGPYCSPSIAQYIKNENAEKFKLQYPEAVYAIKKLPLRG